MFANAPESAAPNATLGSAVERLYGSWDALDSTLDTIGDEPTDLWESAAVWSGSSLGLTGAAIRDLWSRTYPPIVDDEAAVVALALSDDPSPAREAARELL